MDRTLYRGLDRQCWRLMASPRTLGGSAGGDGLRVVGVNPGTIATNRLLSIMKARARDSLGDENRWEELMKSLPMGRAVQTGGNRRDGRSPGIGYFGLHDRNDHHHRRRFGQSLTLF